MADAIRGNWVAIPSPLRNDGGLDEDLFVRHSLYLFGEGVDGVVPFGTTGEGPSFSASERLRGVEALLRAGVEPDRIALGAGFPAIADTVGLIKDVLGMGIVHVLLMPPFYFRNAPVAGIEEALASILDGVNDVRLRTTLYHIPQVSGVRVPALVAASLRHRYGAIIAGVKDSSGDFSQFEAFRDAAPELALLTGHEPDICRALARGGAGTICGVGSVAPADIHAMFVSQAAEATMVTLCNFFEGHQFEPLLKSVLAAQTGDPSWLRVRPPLRPADAAYGQKIAEWISTAQVLPAAGAGSP